MANRRINGPSGGGAQRAFAMFDPAAFRSAVAAEPRRPLYRRSKRALLNLVARARSLPPGAVEPAVRRFLRARPSRFLARVVRDRAFALAAAASLSAAGAAGALPPVFLSDVAAGSGGFVIIGFQGNGRSGFSVSGAGDVNGDGLHDVIVGTFQWPAYAVIGQSYVVFGKADGTPVHLSVVGGGAGGFIIRGADHDDRAGSSVSGAGDVNGDGLDDVIVGAKDADPAGNGSAGESYVVFGKADGDAVDLSGIGETGGGFIIIGTDPDDNSGISVSGAGDVNGDGLDDVLVGAPGADPAGLAGAGETYVVFGKADGIDVNLSAVAAGTGGFVINGIDLADYSGRSVCGAGDVNGDGLADVIVGAFFADPAGSSLAGESYVVFGKADGTAVNLSTVAGGSGGFIINGIDPGDYSGWSVSGAGDVNSDGLDDVIVGAKHAGISGAGESYVVFGKADGTAVNLSAIAGGSGGFIINGIGPFDFSGYSVSGAGDTNGDGLDDVVVGAKWADGAEPAAGQGYVVFGKADGTPVDLSAVVGGTGGFAMNGIEADDNAGFSVSGAGDVNGDGLDDVIMGAIGADQGILRYVGESYVVFSPACGWDCDGNDDGIVGVTDLLTLLAQYDPMSPASCTGGSCDYNQDGCVDVSDLLKLLAHYDPAGLGCP